MCNLTLKLDTPSFTGWKVVAVHKKTGRYYSPAMGCMYRKDGQVPIPKEQKRLTSWFADNILNRSRGWAFVKGMVGRTGVFTNSADANHFMRELLYNHALNDSFTLSVIEATVSKDLMKGIYSFYGHVVAGRRITFHPTTEEATS